MSSKIFIIIFSTWAMFRVQRFTGSGFRGSQVQGSKVHRFTGSGFKGFGIVSIWDRLDLGFWIDEGNVIDLRFGFRIADL